MRLCIIGSGYVGLVSAACFAEMGNSVRCVDVNPQVVQRLQNGDIPIYEPGLEALVRRNHAEGRLTFTTNLQEALRGSSQNPGPAQLAFLCVGTPSQPDGSCDLSAVEAVARSLGQNMVDELVIVDKSTVPVGTADMVRKLVQNELDARGLKLAFDVVSNPEFLKEGDALADFMKPDRVVLGTDSPTSEVLLRDLYAPFARSRNKVIVMGVRSAEMTKYAANCMLATKISFINEISGICEKVGADVRDVRTGIGSDSRIGFQFIYPGVGYGGSCFPKDVKALIHTAKAYGIQPELLDAVENVNARQKRHMARKIIEYFEAQGGVSGKTLALWGLAFKANTDDMRESAALTIISELTALGMKIKAYDPEAMENARMMMENNTQISFCREQYQACAGSDALLVVTEWNQFRNPDFDRVRTLLSAPIVFDGRNIYNPQFLASQGFAYFCVGKGA